MNAAYLFKTKFGIAINQDLTVCKSKVKRLIITQMALQII